MIHDNIGRYSDQLTERNKISISLIRADEENLYTFVLICCVRKTVSNKFNLVNDSSSNGISSFHFPLKRIP